MSSQTTAPSAPFQQWQNFYPASGPAGPYGFGYDQQPVSIQDQIYASVNGNAERTKQQAANDIARDILRAVDQGTALNSHATEITAAQLASAIERNGNANQSTTERVNSQLASAVERNGAANQSAIERTTGEARLTTVVTDAASRQAANDSARDILGAVERTGFAGVATIKDTHNGLLGAIERNAGESRMTTVTVGGQNDAKLALVHNGISTQLNGLEGEFLSTLNNVSSDIKTGVANSAWESRTGISAGFAASTLEASKNTSYLSSKYSDHYSSLMLESQKLSHFMSAKADGHFVSNQLEMQKVKEGITMQAANNFAINQLEMQKVKEGITMQAANNFAINQLEAQKNREAIQRDLSEARYEALKSQQYLTDKMSECCCEIKEKIDLVDRDRLRDNLLVARDDNNLLKVLEFGGRGYERGYGYGGRRGGSRSRSPGRR